MIRVHPAEVKLPGKQTREPLGDYLRQDYRDLPPNVRIVDADDPLSSYPLMAAADVGLVYTSTTGLEMALRGKPVIVAGRTHYRGKGFTLDVSSPTEFTESLEQALDNPAAVAPDLDRARRTRICSSSRPRRSPRCGGTCPRSGPAHDCSLDDLSPGRNADVDRICDEILGGSTALDRTIPNKTP